MLCMILEILILLICGIGVVLSIRIYASENRRDRIERERREEEKRDEEAQRELLREEEKRSREMSDGFQNLMNYGGKLKGGFGDDGTERI